MIQITTNRLDYEILKFHFKTIGLKEEIFEAFKLKNKTYLIHLHTENIIFWTEYIKRIL